ncbi:MAG: hypothetical protein MUO23_06670 [Anaerolineales bacterium]|nr:hypothetical protein [Anaerolineales bacterium]
MSLLALWLAAFGLIGALTESVPAAQRYVAAVPACALIIGSALSSISAGAERLVPRGARWSAAAVAAVAIALAIDDARFYFLDYTPAAPSGGIPLS